MSIRDIRESIAAIMQQEGIRGSDGLRALTVSDLSRPQRLPRLPSGGRILASGGRPSISKNQINTQLDDGDFIRYWGDFLHDVTDGFTTTSLLIDKLSEIPSTIEEPTGVYINRQTGISIYSNNYLQVTLGGSASQIDSGNKLSYLVLNTNKLDPSSRDEDVLAIWLRGIPTTDMSKATPFVRVSFIQPGSASTSQGTPPRMSLDFSLNENNGKIAWGYLSDQDPLFGANSGSQVRNWDKNLNKNRQRATENLTGRRRGRGNNTAASDDKFVESYSDVFHAPQTLRAKNEVLDPYAPLLGLTNFSVNVTPTRGMMSHKTGKMSMVLFDRSRLGDIAPLVSPALYGSTEMRIEWGWKCDLPEAMHTPYTRLLNNLSITEAYGIINSNFNFSPDNNTVNIELSLYQRPQRLVETIPIGLGALSAGGDSIIDNYNAIESAIENINEVLRTIRSSDADLASNLNQSTWLGNGFSLNRALNFNSEELGSIRNFINRNKKSSNANLKSFANQLSALVGTEGSRTERIRGSSNRDDAAASAARQSDLRRREEDLNNQLQILSRAGASISIVERARRDIVARLLENTRAQLRGDDATGGARSESRTINLLGGNLADYRKNMANAVQELIKFIELNININSLAPEQASVFNTYDSALQRLESLRRNTPNNTIAIRAAEGVLRTALSSLQRTLGQISIEFEDPWIKNLVESKPGIFSAPPPPPRRRTRTNARRSNNNANQEQESAQVSEGPAGLASANEIQSQYTINEIIPQEGTRTNRRTSQANNPTSSLGALSELPTNRRGKWTSLGRIMGICVGKPMLNSDKFSELQFVWHNFNEEAGWVHNEPICNLPIYIDELKTVLQKLLEDKGPNLKISDFINSINNNILRNQASRTWGMHDFYEVSPQTGQPELLERYRRDNADFISERNRRLANAYGIASDSNVSVRFRRPVLRMHIEEQPNSESPDKNICRIHIMDSANNTWRSLGDLLAAARVTDVELPTLRNLRGNISPNSVNEINEVNEIIEELIREGVIDTIDRSSGESKVIVRSGFGRIKEKMYGAMPTLRYGSEGSNAISARFSTINNQALNTVNIQRTLSGRNLTPGQGNGSSLPMRISPTQVSVDLIGMPLLRFAQSMFIDFDTNTTADNIYAITGIDYTITPGDFKSSLVMVPPRDAYAQYESTLNVIDNLLAIIESSTDEPDTNSSESGPGTVQPAETIIETAGSD